MILFKLFISVCWHPVLLCIIQNVAISPVLIPFMVSVRSNVLFLYYYMRLDHANWSIHCELIQSVLSYGFIVGCWYISVGEKAHMFLEEIRARMWSTKLFVLVWSKIHDCVFHFVSLICISGHLNSNPSVTLFFHVIWEEFYTSIMYGITIVDLEGGGYQYGSFLWNSISNNGN